MRNYFTFVEVKVMLHHNSQGVIDQNNEAHKQYWLSETTRLVNTKVHWRSAMTSSLVNNSTMASLTLTCCSRQWLNSCQRIYLVGKRKLPQIYQSPLYGHCLSSDNPKPWTNIQNHVIPQENGNSVWSQLTLNK